MRAGPPVPRGREGRRSGRNTGPGKRRQQRRQTRPGSLGAVHPQSEPRSSALVWGCRPSPHSQAPSPVRGGRAREGGGGCRGRLPRDGCWACLQWGVRGDLVIHTVPAHSRLMSDTHGATLYMHVGFPSRGFRVLQWGSFNQFGDLCFNFPNNCRQLLRRKYFRR